MKAVIPYLFAALAASLVVAAMRHVVMEIGGSSVIAIYNLKPLWLIEAQAVLLITVALFTVAGAITALGRGRWSDRLGGQVRARPVLAGAVLIGCIGAAWVGLLLGVRGDLNLLANITPVTIALTLAGWVLAGAAWGAVFWLSGRAMPSKQSAAVG